MEKKKLLILFFEDMLMVENELLVNNLCKFDLFKKSNEFSLISFEQDKLINENQKNIKMKLVNLEIYH